MKALVFARKPARIAAANLAGRVVPGSGASIGALRLRDVDPVTLPSAGWVAIKPRLTGICGSDLATIDGRASSYFEPIVSFPFVPGHEVVADLDDGGRAILIPVLHCRVRSVDPVCRACAGGRTHHCERIAFGHLEPGLQSGYCCDTGGGWSTEMVAHPDQIHPIPDELTDEAAVLVEPSACAVHAARTVRRGPAGASDAVAIIGAGTLGLTTLAALRHLDGHAERPVTVTAKHPAQQALARALGADRVTDPDELSRAVRSATGSLVVGGQITGGVPAVVDCVGSDASLAQALSVVAPGGEVVVVGMPGPTHLDLTSLWHREVALRGCYAYTRDDFATAVDIVTAAGLDRLLSATYPLDRYREAIEHAASAGARGAVKIAFDMRNERHR